MTVLSLPYPYHYPGSYFPLFPFSDDILLDCHGTVELNVAQEDFPKGYRYFPLNQEKIKIPFIELMFCSALAQSPAPTPWCISNWGFLLEHFYSLEKKSGTLRYSPHTTGWDLRVKQIFSERISCGIAMWTLWNVDSVVHIADAAEFIERAAYSSGPYAEKYLKELKLYGKSGKLKPDYFCLTQQTECVIAECKGTMGSPGTLNAEIKKGKQQVSNVKPVGVAPRTLASQLVFATNVRGAHEKPRLTCDSTLKVIDPEFSKDALNVPINADEIALSSYSKALYNMGRGDLSFMLRSGGRLRNLEGMRQYNYRDQIKVIELSRTRDFVFGVDSRVGERLLTESFEGLASRISELQIRAERENRADGDLSVILPNGIAMLHLYGYLQRLT